MKLDIAYEQAPRQRRVRGDPRARRTRREGHHRRPLRTPGPTAPTTTSAAGRRSWRSGKQPRRAHDARAGGPSARSSSPAGTARSTACSARPSGPSSSSASCTRNAVAYLNIDVVGRPEFGAGAAPALDKLLVDVTKTVPEPGAGRRSTTVARRRRGADGRPAGQRLGLHRVPRPRRRPVAGGGLHEPSGEYHSAYDDTYQLEHFLDPGYLGHQAAPRDDLGVTALRLANADVLPLRYSDYATAVRRLRRRLQEVQQQPGAAQVDLGALRDGGPGLGRRGERRWRPARRSCWHDATAATAAATGR